MFGMLLATSVCTLTGTNNRYTLSCGHVLHEDDCDSLRGMLTENPGRKQSLLDGYQQHCLNVLFELAPTASSFKVSNNDFTVINMLLCLNV